MRDSAGIMELLGAGGLLFKKANSLTWYHKSMGVILGLVISRHSTELANRKKQILESSCALRIGLLMECETLLRTPDGSWMFRA